MQPLPLCPWYGHGKIQKCLRVRYAFTSSFLSEKAPITDQERFKKSSKKKNRLGLSDLITKTAFVPYSLSINARGTTLTSKCEHTRNTSRHTTQVSECMIWPTTSLRGTLLVLSLPRPSTGASTWAASPTPFNTLVVRVTSAKRLKPKATQSLREWPRDPDES